MTVRAVWKKSSPTRNRAGRNAGFTLLEVVVTILLFTILAVSIVPSLTLNHRLHQRSSERWRATVEAWNRAGQFQAGEFQDEAQVAIPGSHRVLWILLVERKAGETELVWEVYRAQ